MITATVRLALAALLAIGLLACTRPAEERALADLEVGVADAGGVDVDIAGGLAQIRVLRPPGAAATEPGELSLWAQAPVLALDLDVDPAAAGDWQITVDNALSDAELTVDEASPLTAEPSVRPTLRRFRVALSAGMHHLRVASPDANTVERFRFAAMADIQTALPSVDEVFALINAQPGVRFVISMGDITEASLDAEYDLFEAQLHTLGIPYYTTIGNHDIWEDPARYRLRFGRANVHFDFKGVAFSLLDSGNAGLDPVVDAWLDTWLDAARNRVHVFGTHYPPIDPVGVRAGSFRSRAEGQRLLGRLAAGAVDLTLYGHIHSFVSFENAGIPAYVTGGGGARQEQWDGIGRHFLVVEAVPEEDRIGSVAVVRVD